ncbi:PREDICTED: uncharacterized protein LOC104817130 [Tarenaya hassleriana]|uniref:uncharacterized protein LOC104817130 n=1 Tax=Tarenaya hassleriana TaxID=28532 RepID=UPI00053C3910|nr:PREDICTED: uncharacterized protein LOC104817130 [Tarenaya hassleriana]
MASHLKQTILMVTVMTAAIITASAQETEISDFQEAEILRRLKQLNKPAVKSIQSPDGDIIDCVPIANQPAFDHPLLRDHIIQMRPSSEPESGLAENTEEKPKAIGQLWHMYGECPENTVSIRRTKEEDLLRSTSLETFGKKSYRTIQQVVSRDLGASVHEYGVTQALNNQVYGSKSYINVWKPFVQQSDEFSLAQTWVVSGSGSDLNTIEAGWQEYQQLYGDYNTRLFIYWTRDAYQHTGCYNLLCSAFVQTDGTFVLGGTLNPTSSYGGTQYEISLLIWRDKNTGNWWLQIQGINVGYWPNTLFTSLKDSANRVDWGGEIVNAQSSGHTNTDMGSGHFPEEGFGKAAFFRNLEIVDGSNTLRPPPSLGALAPTPNCYNVRIGGAGTSWATHFYYGGPGKNPNCP